MVTVTRRFEVDAAHRLPMHEGKCVNLHGHRYVFEVTLEGTQDTMGRVLDFYAMKELIGGWLDEHWDHATLVWDEDTELHQWLVAYDQRHYAMPQPPTIENMVEELVDEISNLAHGKPWRVARIVGYETPNCWAEWKEG